MSSKDADEEYNTFSSSPNTLMMTTLYKNNNDIVEEDLGGGSKSTKITSSISTGMYVSDNNDKGKQLQKSINYPPLIGANNNTTYHFHKQQQTEGEEMQMSSTIVDNEEDDDNKNNHKGDVVVEQLKSAFQQKIMTSKQQHQQQTNEEEDEEETAASQFVASPFNKEEDDNKSRSKNDNNKEVEGEEAVAAKEEDRNEDAKQQRVDDKPNSNDNKLLMLLSSTDMTLLATTTSLATKHKTNKTNETIVGEAPFTKKISKINTDINTNSSNIININSIKNNSKISNTTINSSSLSSSTVTRATIAKNIATIRKNTTLAKPSATATATAPSVPVLCHLDLLSLPIDSIHAISSFTAPSDWISLSLTSSSSRRITNDVFKRVRMHSYRCAKEIVTSWKLGEHADARELVALYIKNGVPIYPYSLGHSYHTLIWRMNIEIKEMLKNNTLDAITDANNEENGGGSAVQQQLLVNGGNGGGSRSRNNTDSNSSEQFLNTTFDTAATTARTITNDNITNSTATSSPQQALQTTMMIFDSFYTERHADENGEVTIARQPAPVVPLGAGHDNSALSLSSRQQLQRSSLTYLEEKSIYWYNQKVTGGVSVASSSNANRGVGRRHLGGRSSADTGTLTHHHHHSPKKIHLSVHKHLVDQHNQHKPAINDGKGTMRTPTFNLSADFYHPHKNSCNSRSHYHQKQQKSPTSNTKITIRRNSSSITSNNGNNDNDPEVIIVEPTSTIYSSDNDVFTSDNEDNIMNDNIQQEPDLLVRIENPILSNIVLETYSSSNISSSSTIKRATTFENNIRKHLRHRFTFYQRRLDTILSSLTTASTTGTTSTTTATMNNNGNNNNYANGNTFDECMLDFWDEFFPLTSNIAYYDQHTAVPRKSGLHKFLTNPCPKSIGVVQCEIERIKINSKKKVVNMKGRLFPTYEYRLFIRDRRCDNINNNITYDNNNDSNSCNNKPLREDMILMMAKNRGKKHNKTKDDSSIQVHHASQKRGVNNFYLYKPIQSDIDSHYNTVNKIKGTNSDDSSRGRGNNNKSSKKLSSSRSNGSNITTRHHASNLLGRLQSNFTGTEFQIFSPAICKPSPRRRTVSSRSYHHHERVVSDSVGTGGSCITPTSLLRHCTSCEILDSDDNHGIGGNDEYYESDFAYDSGVSSDTDYTTSSTSRRARSRSGGKRSRSLRRRLSNSGLFNSSGGHNNRESPSSTNGVATTTTGGELPQLTEETTSPLLSSADRRGRKQPIIRAGSWPIISSRSKTNRRVIAADASRTTTSSVAEFMESQRYNKPFCCEEENGAITYTANLLGNRPRIMDVCIPKVSPDGTAGAIWKEYIEEHVNDTNANNDNPSSSSSPYGTSSSSGSSGNRMLQHFKMLQQRLENHDNPVNSDNDNNLVRAGNNNYNNNNNDNNGNNTDATNTTPENNRNATFASDNTNNNYIDEDYGLLALQNRPPWWNVELGAFVLNFGGRVSVASVKNFQLCHRDNSEYIMLQFGRTQGRHSFTMDFQHPLSAVQAFAIAISSLQSKISFG